MILVDTSVWIDHFQKGDLHLAQLLNANQVVMHPLILGELACGNMRNRAAILSLLNDLPSATVATNEETLLYIETHQLMGHGIGFIDASLSSRVINQPNTSLDPR